MERLSSTYKSKKRRKGNIKMVSLLLIVRTTDWMVVDWSVGCWDDWRAAGMAQLKADWMAVATEAQSAGEIV